MEITKEEEVQQWWMSKKYKYGYTLSGMFVGLFLLFLQVGSVLRIGYGYSKIGFLPLVCFISIFSMYLFIFVNFRKRSNKGVPDMKTTTEGLYIFDGFFDHYIQWHEIDSVKTENYFWSIIITVSKSQTVRNKASNGLLKNWFFRRLVKRKTWTFKSFNDRNQLKRTIHRLHTDRLKKNPS